MKSFDRISDAMLDLYEIQKAQIRRLGNKVERLENYIERLEMTIEGHEQYRCDVDMCVEKQRNRIEGLEAVADKAENVAIMLQDFPDNSDTNDKTYKLIIALKAVGYWENDDDYRGVRDESN